MPFEISPERKLIVVHVPKCGGTSLRHSLASRFGSAAIFADYKYFKGKPVVRPAVIDKPIIYGHFPAARYQNEHDAFWVTLLRHPVDRLFSLFFNWRYSAIKQLKNPTDLLRRQVRRGQVDLLEFARQPIAHVLTGKHFAGFDMSRFNLIIAHEHYDAGVARLGAELGVRLDVAYANVSSSRSPAYDRARRKMAADQRVMSELREILRPEIEFYDRAMTLPSVVRSEAGVASSWQARVTPEMITMAERRSRMNALAARVAARRLAGAAWQALTQDDRQARIKAARQEVKQADRQRAIAMLAKKAAHESGLAWRDLPKAQRQELVVEARRSIPRTAPAKRSAAG
jgi:hypothetical protein